MAERPNDVSPGGRGWIDEWLFAAWTADGAAGLVSGHRLLGDGRAWYWSALARRSRPLLHLTEFEVRVRADPFVVKAPEMWAEHHGVVADEQWTIGNEAYFVALDDVAEAARQAYGTPTPVSMDLEWYAAGVPTPIEAGVVHDGVVHGHVELGGEPTLVLHEVPARRWRRATADPQLGPPDLPPARAHLGPRVLFAFPDGEVADWVLTVDGWRRRVTRARAAGPPSRR